MPPTSHDVSSEDEITLRDYWRILVLRRLFILGSVCLTTLVTAAFMFLLPNVYQSKATLLPLGKTVGGVRGMLGELGGVLPLGSLGQEGPAERIQAILHSRTLAEDVIQELNLLPRLFAKQWDAIQQRWQTSKPPTMHDAVRELASLVTITTERKTNVVTIAVEQTDAALAATIANQYIEALQRTLNDKAFSLAKKNRLFTESQVQKTRQELTTAEEALRQFEQQHKIVALEAQMTAAVNVIAMLEGEIMAKEVQLRVLQRSVTGASREATLLQEELQGLRAQLERLLHGSGASHQPVPEAVPNAQVFPAVAEVPEIKLQYSRLQREAILQGKLFTLLMQQLEQAKIEETQDEMAFQVLDRAIPPRQHVKPRRLRSVALAAIVGAFLGVFASFFREYLDPIIHTREQVERQIGIPVLATVPLSRARMRRLQPRQAVSERAELVLPQPSDTAVVEAYRYLYTRLKHLNGERRLRTVLFTSAGPDETLPTLLTNFAIIAAGVGEKILLVDSNARQPTLHHLLQCPPTPGLAEILANPEEWRKGIQATSVANLHLLPTGTVSSVTFTAFEAPVFDLLLARFKEAYELILYLAPPVPGVTDAVVLGSKMDATCLVLSCGDSRFEVVKESKAVLDSVRANSVGVVLRAS
jgi:uncharacterized protein involved in exopolysaccharide biosynthesis/Mrp family chromosome partitioning ATPase